MSLIFPKSYLSKLILLLSIVIVFVLFYLGYLDHSIIILKSEAYTLRFGEFNISLYQLTKSVFLLIVLISLASFISDLISRKINKLKDINPSNRNLLNQVSQIILYLFIFLVVINSLGIDITTLTILSGAIGIGIGFGLQKIASNFISGLILLFEKSVEEGDLVELDGGIYGTVKKTRARYTLVETADGREVFIPNEDFITSKVVNWTYSNKTGRVTINVGVSYDCDLNLVKKLILEAATEHAFCSKKTPPNCFLEEFANSSINFILIFWIDDITKGRFEPRSDVLFSIWKKFKQHHIEIPFPQQDIRIKNLNQINNK